MRRGLLFRLTPWWVLAGAACAGSPAISPETNVWLEQPPADSVLMEPEPETAPAPALAPEPEPSLLLPSLPPMAGSGEIASAKGPRLQFLDAVDKDLNAVLRVLAARFGLQYQIDPAVQGKVNTTLRNTTLFEALEEIIPAGVKYEIRNGVLRVGPTRLETRIFSLDYVALARVGTASTVIQRRLGGSSFASLGNAAGGPGGGPAAAGAGGGADIISATSIADAWDEIRVAVEALTFDATPQGATPEQRGGEGGRPYSRTTTDGRRLIINPIAGTITVSAFPERLEQIEHFIRTFEASIQRQVLIEAKIVEVNLDRRFEFGIDWNVVAANRSARMSPGAGQLGANVQFTLPGGGAQISAVLTALSTQGDVRVLSSPRVSALNNQRAVFDVTTGEIVFNVSSQPIVGPNGATTFLSTVNPTQVNVGIVLDVLPQIGADNTVTMHIRPIVTSVARTASFTSPDGGLHQAPVIDTRETDTMARLRAGETIIIGGLMVTRHERVESGIPVLRSVPLLGSLFSRTVEVERKAELVIFLTPTIIAGQPPATR